VACDANNETIPMKAPRVSMVSDQCSFKGERYLAAKLEDDTYAFVKGNVPVFRRHPLPMDAGEAGKIKHPLDLSALRRKWNDVARGSDSAADWRATWDAFEREATVVRLTRKPYEIN
jgi:hypothetical protein